MTKTKVTKKYQLLKNLFNFLSAACTLGPICFFALTGFINGEEVQKVALGLTSVAGLMLAITSLLFKWHLRSPLFIVLIGLWVALDNILPCIIVIAITTILDESAFTPLKKRYKQLYTINAEIDKRGK